MPDTKDFVNSNTENQQPTFGQFPIELDNELLKVSSFLKLIAGELSKQTGPIQENDFTQSQITHMVNAVEMGRKLIKDYFESMECNQKTIMPALKKLEGLTIYDIATIFKVNNKTPSRAELSILGSMIWESLNKNADQLEVISYVLADSKDFKEVDRSYTNEEAYKSSCNAMKGVIDSIRHTADIVSEFVEGGGMFKKWMPADNV